MNFPIRLHKKLKLREENKALRKLSLQNNLIDFSSNDYLGFSTNQTIYQKANSLVQEYQNINGSTGSRLLSGNHILHEEVEQQLASFFNSKTALLFNSGYDANIGLFSAILQRGDIILYDEYIHASIRDGIQMSTANAFKFKHNDLVGLEQKLMRHSKLDTKWRSLNVVIERILPVGRQGRNEVEVSRRGEEFHQEVYVVTESVFSMDGDSPDLLAISDLCNKYNTHLIVDEAHATGVLGKNGGGLVQELGLEKKVFARVHTFGKALGCHGAVILGSEELRTYLINFARSFIYTTAIPLHSVATIKVVLEELDTEAWSLSGSCLSADRVEVSESEESQIIKLKSNIQYFNQQRSTNNNQLNFIKSNSAIHCCIIPGNEKVKIIAQKLQKKGFDVKPILSPTVPNKQERLRICLHSYNSEKEIDEVLKLLAIFVDESSLRTK